MDEAGCSALIDKCKIEAKKLVEFTTSRRRIHWTHPSFVSFCISVADILSCGVKRPFRSKESASVTVSGKILREVGKAFPDALKIYNKCFSGSTEDGVEDYAIIQSSSHTEKRILWIRIAVVEGKLAAVVAYIMKKPGLYYEKQSVVCHPVYGEIFQSLIDGPCSIRYSRLKVSETVSSVPSPAELINRHKKILSLSALTDDKGTDSMPTEKAWDHVQSLYQTNSAICLFGKNSILVKPVGLSSAIHGYLTLQLSGTKLNLKWIPNALLKDSSFAQSGLWEHVISVDMVDDIAHIHCHRAQGCAAEMILIGYDGIGHPPLLFPHQPSLFMFLECLEDSLLPKGCLEPPLWFLKTKTKTKTSSSKTSFSPVPVDDDDWVNKMEVWNQVFRIRYGGRDSLQEHTKSIAHGDKSQANPLPLTFAPYHRNGYESSGEESSSDEEGGGVFMENPGCLARRDWEKLQTEVSKQLQARYFYSWLSHCRHMIKVRLLVAHLVSPTCMVSVDDVIAKKPHPVVDREWEEFHALSPHEREVRWEAMLKNIYLRGLDHSIRSKVWPYLLGVYPIGSTSQDREAIMTQVTHTYSDLLVGWKTAEATNKNLQGVEEGSEETSPVLSSVSASPASSPRHAHTTDDEWAEPDEEIPIESYEATPTTNEQDNSTLIRECTLLHNGLDIDPLVSHDELPMSCDFIRPLSQLDALESVFVQELHNIDKDVPRCDRDYWYFKLPGNLLKLRNIVCCYVWGHLGEGYSQGMCDLLAPILVVVGNEPLTFACFLKLMEKASKLFPPNTGMNTRLANLQSLLQVLEADYHHYLTDRPMGDGFFYCYRWLLVSFKREFSYSDLFRIWETIWAARLTVSDHLEEFIAIAIMKQFQSAIMDAHLDPSDILNLFTDLADKNSIDCEVTMSTAIMTVSKLQQDIMKQ